MSNKNNKKGLGNKKETPGSLLRKARNAKDFSVQHVATQLRLSSSIIDALENNDLGKLPAPIFVRGYIKNYATLTGVSSDRIVATYNNIIGEESAVSLSTVRVSDVAVEADRKWKQFLPAAIVAMLILLGVIIWLSSDSVPEVAVEEKIDAGVEAVDHISPVDEGSLILPVEDTTSLIEEKDTGIKGVEDNKTPVAEKESINHEQVDAVNRTDRLVFKFSADSWTDVSDAKGTRLIFRMVRAGQEKTVTGQSPFKITLGNASKVRLLRNDIVIDLTPYIRGKVAKFSLGRKQ